MTNKKAFTLLEVVIVIVIIGVLASLAIPRFLNMVEGARVTEAVATIGTIRSAIERCYLMNNGSYAPCDGSLSSGEGGGWGSNGQFNIWAGVFSSGTVLVPCLDIDDPGLAPGAHFWYMVRTTPHSYVICANRKNLFVPFNGGDSYPVCFGFGVQLYADEIYANAIGAGETSFVWINDNKYYWETEDRFKGFIPRTQ